jgi:hypothetical protein
VHARIRVSRLEHQAISQANALTDLHVSGVDHQ